MADPAPEPLEPQTVEVPKADATPQTVRVAEEALEKAEKILEKAPAGPNLDKATAILEEIRDGIRTLNEKLDRPDAVVPAKDLTAAERKVRDASDPKKRAGFFGWLDDLFE